MADLKALLEQLAECDANNDHEGLRKVREQIVGDHPESDQSVEALYKIGLDNLFRQRKLEDAVEIFGVAAKRKHPYWSAAARTSQGICLYHQGKKQKAIFELRKVGNTEKPSEHSVTALSFIETIFLNEGNNEEVTRVRKERMSQLNILIQEARNGGDKSGLGQNLYSYGLALIDSDDADGAKQAFAEAKEMGPEILGAELFRAVVDALK